MDRHAVALLSRTREVPFVFLTLEPRNLGPKHTYLTFPSQHGANAEFDKAIR